MASFDADWDIVYAPEDDMDKVRTVGVEFECSITNEDCPLYSCDYEDDYDDRDYVESWLEKEYGLYIPGIGIDGSGYEFVTEPESFTLYEQGGSDRFKTFVKFLKENGEPRTPDGTHIHIGKLSTDNDLHFKHLKWLTANYSLQMNKIFGRVSNWCATQSQLFFHDRCHQRMEQQIDHILIPKDYKKITDIPYNNKGGMIINRTHTYEFRGGKGTNDLEEVLAWIEMVHNFVELAKKSKDTIENTPFSELVKGKYLEEYIKKIQSNPNREFIDEEFTQTIAKNNYIQAVTVPSSYSVIL